MLLTQIGVSTAYASHVLPGLVVTGLGLGLVFAISFEVGTMGVQKSDAGVASAMVNNTQQVGGSIGTALLSTLFATAVASSLTTAADPGSQLAQAEAAVHGYSVAFWWSAAMFLIAAVACAFILTSGVPEHDPDAPGVVTA